MLAEAIHRASACAGPFVAIDCAAMPRDLVESELFGYARGAHSQAARSKPGLVEQAQGGTLFLDEIAEMPMDVQAKLLRFLQTGSFMPLGAVARTRVDVRVLAATNRSVLGEGSGLRPDLAARLGSHPVVIPPLRHRMEDFGRLCARFLGDRLRPLQLSAFRRLCLYRWPGNVRQLRKVITEAGVLAGSNNRISTEHLPDLFRAQAEAPITAVLTPPPLRRQRRAAPSPELLEQLLARHRGNVASVARDLDRRWAVVWRSIVRNGIDVEKFRHDDRRR